MEKGIQNKFKEHSDKREHLVKEMHGRFNKIRDFNSEIREKLKESELMVSSFKQSAEEVQEQDYAYAKTLKNIAESFSLN